ncbi:polymorphic toxin-type HINT domain-containing protein [Dictyobacter arantiisoli]|uniref:Hint domain-containing protein n=1 Tax=Dictyobacter arantiisoli TaxID=2014874 RepID=A0A5A5T994_9CHLR|nr:polymorphic toxin-type HINT domain-containing protein [Dictyobacter arantiisoli]GCF07603.1 hypothetical protein KDI_11670 [Dictyobacter arantiisoli]
MVNDVQTLSGNGSMWDKAVAGGDLAMNAGMDISMLFGVGEELRGGELALKGGADLAEHLAESCALSFSYDTTVMTAGGALAIGSLRVGEKVLAYNTQTQHMELEPIKHVWINHDTDLVNLAITTTTTDKKGQRHEKDEVIHTTAKHPFLTQEEGFVPVSQLHIGLHIRKADGSYGVVSGWQSLPGASTMYNLEVTQDHTYTVGDGQWVVHNCGGEVLPDLFESVVAKHKKNILDGASLESIILFLHDDGLTIVESIKALKILYAISLGEAKILVNEHFVWKNVVVSHQSFHRELENAIEAEANK